MRNIFIYSNQKVVFSVFKCTKMQGYKTYLRVFGFYIDR